MATFSGALRVRSLQGVQWRSLPGTEGASDAFWSPDSTTLGFFAGGRLRSVSIDGTNSRNLAPAPDSQGGSWRGSVADGTILFASARRLQILDLRTGTVTPLPLKLGDGEAPSLPIFCPEGNGFVYTTTARRALFRSALGSSETQGHHVVDTTYGVKFAQHPHTGRWQIFFVRTESTPGIANRTLVTAPIDPRTGALAGEAVPVADAMANWVGTGYAAFDVVSNGLIYWRHSTPSLSIWRLRWFDRNGNVTGAVGDAAGYAALALSPDESKVAALQGYPDQHIWVYNLQNGTGVRVPAMPGSEDRPIWSPDGRSLYYASQTDAGSRVVRQSVEAGSAPEVLYSATDEKLAFHVQAIAPDARTLILTQTAAADAAIVRLDLSASPESRRPEVLLGKSDFGSTIRLTPDGRTMLISSVGRLSVCRFPPTGDSPRQIAAFPTFAWPFFSPDGRTLYVISAQSLYSLPVLPAPDGGIRLGERSLLFRLLHPFRTDSNIGAVSRDGSRFLAITADSTEEARHQVVTDWTSLVRR